MTGQLALPFPDPIPVVEGFHRGQRITVRRVAYTPPLRKSHMWWRGRRRHVANVPVTIGGVL